MCIFVKPCQHKSSDNLKVSQAVASFLFIVDPTPRVTRDRHYERLRWEEKGFILVDTGGIDDNPEDLMVQHIREQAMAAIEEADTASRPCFPPSARSIASIRQLFPPLR